MNDFHLGVIYCYLRASNAPDYVMEAMESLHPDSTPIVALNEPERAPKADWRDNAKIIIGAVCKKCGHVERYACNSRCVHCQKNSASQSKDKEKQSQTMKVNGGKVQWDFSKDNLGVNNETISAR